MSQAFLSAPAERDLIKKRQERAKRSRVRMVARGIAPLRLREKTPRATSEGNAS